jgi:hypothetical protein
MSYNADGLQLLGIGGAIAETFPTAGTVRKVYSYVTNDSMATILTDAYFDGINGDPLVEGDLILVAFEIDGEFSGAATLFVEVGGSDVTVVPLESTPFGTATTSGNIGNSGVSYVGSTTAALVYNLDAPAKGVRKILRTAHAGTTGPATKVSTTGSGATVNGTTDAVINFALGNGTAGITCELLGLSATAWQIIATYPGSTYVLTT